VTTSPIRVFLADDHGVLRAGLRALLEDEEDIRVVGEADSGEEAIDRTIELRPDVVVMDLGMPGKGGMEAIRQIKRQLKHVHVIVLSMHSGREVVMQAIEAGSDGYVPKSAAHANLLQAIRAVHAGQRFLDPSAATVVVDRLMEREAESQLLGVLSDRELEVLRQTARGFTSREIGDQLALSPKTVDTYRLRAMGKLNLNHRSDLIRFALRTGLLDGS
jgi:two-component system response regulator NreC